MEKFLIVGSKVSSTHTAKNKSEAPSITPNKKTKSAEDIYLHLGFKCILIGGAKQPQCVICLKTLSSESLKPNKLKRHLETNHNHLAKKNLEFFDQKSKENAQQQKNTTVPAKALVASYKVAYRIAKSKKPHTIAEDLILPAAFDMVTAMLGEASAKVLQSIPLSNDTVARRITDMAEDLNEQLVEKLQSIMFALQVDEATDSAKDAHLIAYIRFVDDDNIHEDLFFCKEITGTCTAKDLFYILDKYVAENNLDWENCVGLCTDGARSMSGRYNGLQALIWKKAPEALWTHCMIHRQALASKDLSPILDQILQTTITVVNFIKTRPLKARLFAKLYDEMGADFTSLLFYCESRWLSHGNVLKQVFELRMELLQYLTRENHPSAQLFSNTDFLLKPAYLTDIFEKLNILNSSLQGVDCNIIQHNEKLNSFIKKIELWKRKLAAQQLDMFRHLKEFTVSNQLDLCEEVRSCILDHLSSLKKHLKWKITTGLRILSMLN